METLKCIKERRSIRKFKDTPVKEELLRTLVEHASFSPSWKNTGICRYNIICHKEKITDLANTCFGSFEHNKGILLGAPCVIAVSYVEGRCGYERDGSYTTSKGAAWQMFDAGIACQTLSLAAHDLGLSSVIMGIFDEDLVAKKIDLPEGEVVAAVMAVGYADEEPAAPKRKDVDMLLRMSE